MTRTTRRDQILVYISEYASEHHNAPSTYQIAEASGVSQVRVRYCLRQLADEGRIEYIDGKLRVVGAEYIPAETG